jgi:integrase
MQSIGQPKTTKQIKKIKENISLKEYKKLTNSINGNDSIRIQTKSNLLRTFCILFYTGLRLNEIQNMRIYHIKELIETGTTKIDTSKTSTERKIYLSDDFKKDLLKIFNMNENSEHRIIHRSNLCFTGLHKIAYISLLNRHIKDILGNGYSSHSFRQGIISEMGSKGINTKIISKFIGHSDIKTTMRYIRPTDEDIIKSIIR